MLFLLEFIMFRVFCSYFTGVLYSVPKMCYDSFHQKYISISKNEFSRIENCILNFLEVDYYEMIFNDGIFYILRVYVKIFVIVLIFSIFG